MRIISSSPGKVILFGEHFVVKGSLAVASAINLRTNVLLEPKSSWPIEIKSVPLNKSIKIERDLRVSGSRELKHFIKILEILSERGIKIKPFSAKIYGDLPVAVGLGSSASSAASLASAIAKYLDIELNKEELFYITNEVEKLIHERPSGIDSAIVVYGGTIVYKKGEKPKPIELKWKDNYSLLIACTRLKRRTGEVVSQVLKLAESHWDILKHVYRAAEALVEKALRCIQKGNIELLGTLMNINQGLLYAIGVSNLELERLIFATRDAGCLGSKITGAGKGGCIISLCKDVKDVLSNVRKVTNLAFMTSLGAQGTTVKVIDNTR
jgi:mevalonate kinase